jgi:monovalent cation:H+ antiporter-2, CPA2 family
MQDVLLQVLIYLAAAVIAVPITQRLGFGSVLGYLVAGVAIGPVFGLVGAETEDLQHYAEFGVVLMLFLIGLELEPKVLWAMRDRLIGLGGLQVGLTLAAVSAVCLGIGLPWNQSLAIGMILCLSSTAIVMQTLNEKRLTRTEGGRSSFAVLLFQDIAAIPFLALIPLLAPWGPLAGEEQHELVRELTPWTRALLVVGAVLLVVVMGRFLTGPIFRFLSLARLHEIYVAAALLFVVAIATVMGMLGLSPALGTFLAGVALANSEYKHEIEADIAPFKGLLLGLFFITVGAGMNPSLLAERPIAILGLALALIALKLAILHVLAIAFKLRDGDRLLFTLSLAQAGEFAFFLTIFATANLVLSGRQADMLLMVVSLSMFLTPALFVIHDKLITRLRQRARRRPDDDIDEHGTVIIAGMGRFGQIVNRMVRGLGHKTVVLDSHPGVIERMRRFGIRAFYGEVDRPALLEAAGIADARVLVLALDDPEKALHMARYVSRRHPQVKIIARARDRHHVYQLYAAGVPDSVREVFDSAVRAGKYTLAALGYSDDEIERVGQAFFEHDRNMLAELAELWDPDVPIDRNSAYIAKAREQAATIEAAFRGQLNAAGKAAE